MLVLGTFSAWSFRQLTLPGWLCQSIAIKPMKIFCNPLIVIVAALAFASPLRAQTNTLATTNTGTASVASLNVVTTPSTPYASVSIAFTAASGNGRGYEVRDANDRFGCCL